MSGAKLSRMNFWLFWGGSQSVLRQLAAVVALTSLILTSATCWAYWSHGSIGRSLSYLNGDRVHLETAVAKLGVVQAGKSYETKVPIDNLGDRPLLLLGANPSCGCVTLDPFPVTLAPRSRYELAVRYVPDFNRQGPVLVRVFTDDGRRPEIQIQVIAEAITPDPAKPAGRDNSDTDLQLEPVASAPSSGH